MHNKEGLDMDNLFKALLIIILGAFLYLYYENSNNDRYSFSSSKLFDKKTGTIYYDSPPYGTVPFYSVNYINGTLEKIEKDNK